MKYRFDISDEDIQEVGYSGNKEEIVSLVEYFNSVSEEAQRYLVAIILTEVIIDDLSSPPQTSGIN
jgi:hypothetical protein